MIKIRNKITKKIIDYFKHSYMYSWLQQPIREYSITSGSILFRGFLDINKKMVRVLEPLLQRIDMFTEWFIKNPLYYGAIIILIALIINTLFIELSEHKTPPLILRGIIVTISLAVLYLFHKEQNYIKLCRFLKHWMNKFAGEELWK